MPTIELTPRLRAASRIEKRCRRCEPATGVAKVPAVSVSDGVRCDECGAPVWSGDRFWAVVIDDVAA